MRILILGNNHSAESFYRTLSENKDNIVFSTCYGVKNRVEYNNEDDIAEFCEANDINFVISTDTEYVKSFLQDKLNSAEITNFAPSEEAVNICKYRSYAKKFINKNKFLSPKYFIAERANLAFDYLKTVNYPITISPDIHSFRECPQFAETFGQAQKIINRFFESGNKKVITEDYISGKNFTLWTISDGYSAKIIGANAKYQNDIGLFEPEFLTSEIKNRLLETVVNPAIRSLASQEEEYTGILGFDFILNSNQEAYLVGFNSFFDDISVDFFINCYEINWPDVFESCIIGDVISKYDFVPDNEYAVTIRNEDKIDFVSAKIKTNLDKYVEELGYDTKEYKEAMKIWKY